MPHFSPNLDPINARAVLFDLDGTLLDSFNAHFESYKTMFSRFDIKVTKEQFLQTYSPDWYRTYEALGLPKDQWERANTYWLDAAARQKPDVFPGVRETLRKLGKSIKIGLVSSGSKVRVMNDIKRTQISDCFEVIITGEDIRFPKPHPEGLQKALGGMRLRPQEALYVGDAEADWEMARAASVPFVGVKSAFAGLRSDSYRVVESIGEIPRLLSKY